MTEYQQKFTAPGTWVKPDVVTRVDVIVVGGGGGGAALNPAPAPTGHTRAGGGGGGAYVYKNLPVTGPVSITVGAGGSGGPPSSPNVGGIGGTSAFGPLGPGPIPDIPPDTVAAGGGGAGCGHTPTSNPPAPDQAFSNAPPIGGGGGAGVVDTTGSQGGIGYPANGFSTPNKWGIASGGAGGTGYFDNHSQMNAPGPSALSMSLPYAGKGFADTNYGAGGISIFQNPVLPVSLGGVAIVFGTSPVGRGGNIGRGGDARLSPAPAADSDGDDGVIIVRWYA